ncbi:MAG TPA: 4-hydroxy-tetrahydrodipicolinate synthase [bacterium]
MFRGTTVAIITPFQNGKIDEKALKKLIDFLIQNGVDGIVPCGTTGESATLSHEEHQRVVDITIEHVNKRIFVIAGSGSNSTQEAIRLSKHAEKAGADGALLITPYYNKPTQEGLYQHFKSVSENTNIPIVLYNVPGRTGVNMLPETVARLAELKNIVAIKEATGDLKQVSDVINLCPKDFAVLSGDDFTTLPILSVGGMGVISVTANVAPKDVSGMVNAYLKGDYKKALELHYKLWNMNRAMFVETNPIPVKTGLALMGMASPEMRLPLCQISEGNLQKLKKALKEHNLLKE